MLKSLTIAFLALIIMSQASAETVTTEPTKNILVLVDLSESVPILTDAAYAEYVAERTVEGISGLQIGSVIRLRTLGDYSTESNPMRLEWKVGPTTARPEMVINQLSAAIAAVPSQVEAGNLEPQGSTHLIAAVEELAWEIECSNDATWTVIMVTDGRDTSGEGFPEQIAYPWYEGCDQLQIIGINGATPAETRQLRNSWADFSEQLGFQSRLKVVRQ